MSNLSKWVAGIAALCCASTALAEGWEHEVELYAQAISITGDAGVGRIEGSEVDVDMDDILENLDWAFMGRYEAMNTDSNWGFAIDYANMDLSSDFTAPQNGIANLGVSQGVLEAIAIKRRLMNNRKLDFLVGVRWWNNDFDLLVDSSELPGQVSREVDVDWVDIIVGARMIQQLGDDWYFMLRGDIGGVGSNFTSLVQVGLWWEFAENWQARAGYKSIWVDYEDGEVGNPDYFAYDTQTSGPLLGIVYQF